MDKKTGVRDPNEKVVEIEMERLRAFPNHPFKVIGDSQMIELQDSIKKYGVLNGMNIRSCIRKSAGCLRSRIWKKTISVCRRQQPSPGLPAEQSPNGFRWSIFQLPGQERP